MCPQKEHEEPAKLQQTPSQDYNSNQRNLQNPTKLVQKYGKKGKVSRLKKQYEKIAGSNSSRLDSPLSSTPFISSGRDSPGLLLVASLRVMRARRAVKLSSLTCTRCPFRSGWGDERNVWARAGQERSAERCRPAPGLPLPTEDGLGLETAAPVHTSAAAPPKRRVTSPRTSSPCLRFPAGERRSPGSFLGGRRPLTASSLEAAALPDPALPQ